MWNLGSLTRALIPTPHWRRILNSGPPRKSHNSFTLKKLTLWSKMIVPFASYQQYIENSIFPYSGIFIDDCFNLVFVFRGHLLFLFSWVSVWFMMSVFQMFISIYVSLFKCLLKSFSLLAFGYFPLTNRTMKPQRCILEFHSFFNIVSDFALWSNFLILAEFSNLKSFFFSSVHSAVDTVT